MNRRATFGVLFHEVAEKGLGNKALHTPYHRVSACSETGISIVPGETRPASQASNENVIFAMPLPALSGTQAVHQDPRLGIYQDRL